MVIRLNLKMNQPSRPCCLRSTVFLYSSSSPSVRWLKGLGGAGGAWSSSSNCMVLQRKTWTGQRLFFRTGLGGTKHSWGLPEWWWENGRRLKNSPDKWPQIKELQILTFGDSPEKQPMTLQRSSPVLKPCTHPEHLTGFLRPILKYQQTTVYY